MKTLAQFKAEQKIDKIDLMQGKGRMFAKVNTIDVVVSKECKLNEALYVIPLTKEGGTPVPNAVLLVNNTSVKVVASL